jgi:MoxR-like ATPase
MQDNEQLQQETAQFKERYHTAREEVGRIMVGQHGVIEGVLTALLAGGNVLLEGVPGLGKTELVKTLSHVLDLHFRRVQFTPDLMPADIIGTNIMSTSEGGGYRLEFRRGPIFTQLLLADEINRATPKTQSALLETMQEGSVTVGGKTYHLDPPFFVMATQNPLEQEGTYPLPEAQLDRFMFKIDVPFPNRDELNEVVERTILREPVEVRKVLDRETIMTLRETLDKVVVAAPIRDYAVRLVLATHPESEVAPEDVKRFVRWGASPRAAQALIRAGRVRALADGRAHVAFEDVRHFALHVLRHRAILNYDGQAEGIAVADLVTDICKALPEEG